MSLKIKELFDVSGKVALVTGGSRGIGEMITSGFLANGTKVYITARKEEALNLKAKELSTKYDLECIPFSGDLSTLEGIEELVNFINETQNDLILFIGLKCITIDLTFGFGKKQLEETSNFLRKANL